MTRDAFRRLALSFPETEEKDHMNHPDFRVAGKIFATLSYPQEGWAMVKLTPEQQQEFIHDQPEVFIAVKGGWGRKGCTNVLLKKAKNAIVRQALLAAWCNQAPQQLDRQRLTGKGGTVKTNRKGRQEESGTARPTKSSDRA